MEFFKYQGAGNDFVMIDQRNERWLGREHQILIEHLCDRRFGIGADGLILLENKAGYDFEMIYFNSDGRESTMCGNGGRCIAAFAKDLGIVTDSCRFMAIDGAHEAKINPVEDTTFARTTAWVELKMSNVAQVTAQDDSYVLNTGSPHYVRFVADVNALDMYQEGRAVRYSDPFKAQGINVNLVDQQPGQLNIRTYERGVEDETFACGTGVTAAAIAAFVKSGAQNGHFEIAVKAKGGDLSVRLFANGDGSFSDIWLCGPAQQVFRGNW